MVSYDSATTPAFLGSIQVASDPAYTLADKVRKHIQAPQTPRSNQFQCLLSGGFVHSELISDGLGS
jgi:hypothetical protein